VHKAGFHSGGNVPSLTDAQLAGEVEDLMRTMPPRPTMRHQTDENLAWFGRARAILESWNDDRAAEFGMLLDSFFGNDARSAGSSFARMMVIINHARWDLRMKATGPLSVVVDRGQPFDYFDEVRKVIATAQNEILFVYPYLEADFVSRYLPHVRQGVGIRLLTSKHLAALLSAVEQFAQQHSASIEVRKSTARPHDRYVFVDRAQCFLSSASFKDGGRLSPSTLQQITDTFADLHRIYEADWANASVERAP
jgi:hypothetical protein